MNNKNVIDTEEKSSSIKTISFNKIAFGELQISLPEQITITYDGSCVSSTEIYYAIYCDIIQKWEKTLKELEQTKKSLIALSKAYNKLKGINIKRKGSRHEN